ncbi:MAG: hypothetical protein FJX74_06050, partial [Armatimonadetes bacterium]|nr:hypothetical protein [Armatimonadota bacterium]
MRAVLVEVVVRVTLAVSCVVALGWVVTSALGRRASAALRSAVWRAMVLAFWAAPLVGWWTAAHPAGRATIRVEAPAMIVERLTTRVERAPLPAEFTPASATGTAMPAQSARAAPEWVPPTPAEALSGVWLLGAWAGLALFVWGLVSVHGLLRSSAAFESPGLLAEVVRRAEQLGLRRAPRVVSSDRVDSPTLMGLATPTLVLPQRVPANAAHLNAALIHELAHIRRGDLPMQLLACLTRAVWWWNPLAWLAARKLSDAAEEACDDWVVALTGNRAAYAEAVAEWAQAARSPSPLTCSWQGSRLVRRVRRILAEGPRPTLTLPSWQRATVAGALLLLAAGVGVTRLQQTAAARAEGSAPHPDGPPPRAHITGRVVLPDGVTPAAGAIV